MQDGPKPEFLQKHVAYYVMDTDKWRYADTLEAVTAEQRPYYLDSVANATDVLASGSLGARRAKGKPDHYVYDPRDVSIAAVEATVDPASLTDQRLDPCPRGKQLVYHTRAVRARYRDQRLLQAVGVDRDRSARHRLRRDRLRDPPGRQLDLR